MGEYILMPDGKVKLGTCEDLFYVTFGWLKKAVETGVARHDPCNLEPREYLNEKGKWRYRFPWPDEQGFGDDYDRGLEITMPEDERCDCGSPTQKILMQKQVDGRLEVVARCSGCEGLFRWNAECAKKVVALLRDTHGDDKFMMDVAHFIEMGYDRLYVTPLRHVGRVDQSWKKGSYEAALALYNLAA